ncbi:MAG: 4-hydroxy-3-methylbut-2-enyl diphosphate reductase [Gammaproteobacteria bacterium AqS3]|nr:4-hydroxy-3-methylbut-2-enyl diphosphate reductase [Gammaproteobacteria bacterium AqS3]
MTHVLLANPRGFCAGVERAIAIVEQVLNNFGAPIYVHNHIVHNRRVVGDLRARGVTFVRDLSEIPDGAVCIFSAHGVARRVVESAEARGLKVFDATCPLVTKVHIEVARYAQAGMDCIIVGHSGHPEIEGTRGRYDGPGQVYLVEDVEQAGAVCVGNPERVGLVSQTTLSVRDTEEIVTVLRRRFPEIAVPRRGDICYATQNRQNAVLELAGRVERLLVVGSPHSSNSNRLCELAEAEGVPAHLIDAVDAIQPEWLSDVRYLGVTAGASAPETLVQEVLERLRHLGAERIVEMPGAPERVRFAMPKELCA